jgi:hypothetical protein
MGECSDPVGEGATCRRADPNQCPADQYCDAEAPGEEGTCLDRPVDGDPCLTRTQACADGHVCLDDDLCHAIKAVGETCSEHVECYSGFCLDGACEGPLVCEP